MKSRHPIVLKNLILIVFIVFSATGSILAQINQSATLQGKITNIRNSEEISFIEVIANNGNHKFNILSNESGDYIFKNLPLGVYKITIPSLYFKLEEITLTVKKDEILNISLEPIQRVLDEVYITASEAKGVTSSSIIDRKAMEHLQPSSFTDLLELLPGGRSVDPNLTVMNQIRLRETGIENDAYDISSLGTTFYIDGTPINTTANMQSTTGYTSSISENTSRSSTNKGVDMRSISTDQIEKVEIVRGIPSVEYGDLTSGLIKIERKKGSMPYTVRMKTDGFSKLISAGKGLSFPEKNLFINADIDFLNSKADPRDNFENYKRLTGSVRTEKYWEKDFGKLTWNAGFDYGITIDNERSDPDNSYALTDRYKSQFNSFSLSNQLNFKFNKNSLLKSINVSTKLSYQNDVINQTNWIQARSATILTNSLEAGVHDASFLTPSYAADLIVEGKPLNVFVKAMANLGFNSGKINHQIKLGAESNYSKNFGRGQMYDLDYPATASIAVRPRSYRSIPATQNLSFFAEDMLHLIAGEHQFVLSAGIRGMGLTNMNDQYKIANKLYLDPRINTKWALPTMEINNRNLSITLGGGYGLHTKLPTLDLIYPNPKYEDLVQLNFYHTNPEYRRASVMTYIIDNTNYDLNAAVNKKWEVNMDINYAGNRLSITYFKENMNSGFRKASRYKALDYRKYDNTSIDASNIIAQPSLIDFEYEDVREFSDYSINSNGSTINKDGIEYQFTTNRISRINTRITINGAWFKSTYTNSLPLYKVIDRNITTNGKTRQYIGIYDDNDGSVKQQFNSNLILDSYLPKLGLIISTSVQNMWYTSRRTMYKSGTPIQYIDINENVYPYMEADKSDVNLQWLNIKYHETNFRKYTVPIDLQVNFKATKEFKDKIRVSMFVNRILTYTPDYISYGIKTRRQGLTSPYFGMELNIRL